MQIFERRWRSKKSVEIKTYRLFFFLPINTAIENRDDHEIRTITINLLLVCVIINCSCCLTTRCWSCFYLPRLHFLYHYMNCMIWVKWGKFKRKTFVILAVASSFLEHILPYVICLPLPLRVRTQSWLLRKIFLKK